MTLPRLIQQDTDGVWKHHGTLIVANLQTPPGAITTEMLAPDAAEARIGMYAQAVNWSLPQANTWTETPVQVTVSLSGAMVRVEFNVLFGCPNKGQRIFYAIMVDGVQPAPNGALGALDSPENNYGMMAVGTYYVIPASAGTHRIALGIAGPANSQIFDVIASTLYVTEQKR